MKVKCNNIIILAKGINGLGAIRSAAAQHLNIFCVFFADNDLGTYSKYVTYKRILSDDYNSKELLKILKEIFLKYGKASIICCSDEAIDFVLEQKENIKKFHYFIAPDNITVNALNDKKLECIAAIRYGVNIPKTYINLYEATDGVFPLLIKPRTYNDYEILKAKNQIVSCKEELKEFIQIFSSKIDRFIAQEIITGGDKELWVCNVTFNNNHELISCFIFQRLGTMPSHYGVTSLAVSKSNDVLVEECKKIGQAFKYSGPAMIEFKRCSINNNYFYIETNPRIGMCNWFDTSCGVNNVYATHLLAQGFETKFLSQINNKCFINLSGDFIARIENREKLWSIFQAYIKLLSVKKVGATFTLKDPLPGIYYNISNLFSFLKRLSKFLMTQKNKLKLLIVFLNAI